MNSNVRSFALCPFSCLVTYILLLLSSHQLTLTEALPDLALPSQKPRSHLDFLPSSTHIWGTGYKQFSPHPTPPPVVLPLWISAWVSEFNFANKLRKSDRSLFCLCRPGELPSEYLEGWEGGFIMWKKNNKFEEQQANLSVVLESSYNNLVKETI